MGDYRVPVDLLGVHVPAAPTWCLGAATGVVALVVGALIAHFGRPAEVGAPANAAAGTAARTGASAGALVRLARLGSGVGLSSIGGVLGYVLAGPIGVFVGTPLAPLGYAVARGHRAGSDWSIWRATFIAGWIGTWIGEIACGFGARLLPPVLYPPGTFDHVTLALPTTQTLTVAVGLVTALLARRGGVFVAETSRPEGAAAFLSAGLVWFLGFLAALLIFLHGYLPPRSTGLVGLMPTDTPLRLVASTAAYLGVSLFLGAQVIPYLVARKERRAGAPARPGDPNTSGRTFRGSVGASAALLVGAALWYAYLATFPIYWSGDPSGQELAVGLYLGVWALVGAAIGVVVLPEDAGASRASYEAYLATLGETVYGIFTGGSLSILLVLGALVALGRLSVAELAFGIALGLGVFLLAAHEALGEVTVQRAVAGLRRT